MKKLLSKILAVSLSCAALIGTTACDKNETFSVYAPDGAPALALVNAISRNESDFEYHIVDPSLIQTQVTGKNPNADFCILPLNLASKLLGDGETYTMLGTVTNGNLYFLSSAGERLTPENIKTTLIEKTVGVVQLPNVPGLTLRAVLRDYEIPYQMIESLQVQKEAGKVHLLAVDAANVSPAYGCDYYLCPEPAASTKCKATQGALKRAGDLQELYGEGGYPQAVLVAKNAVIENAKDAVHKMLAYMQGSADYLETVSPETVLTLLDGKRTAGLTPSFDANNLSKEVIQNCSVRFTSAESAKPSVISFLEKLIRVNEASAKRVSDGFFYTEAL